MEIENLEGNIFDVLDLDNISTNSMQRIPTILTASYNPDDNINKLNNMKDLPKDCIESILGFLPKDDLFKFSGLTKKYRSYLKGFFNSDSKRKFIVRQPYVLHHFNNIDIESPLPLDHIAWNQETKKNCFLF